MCIHFGLVSYAQELISCFNSLVAHWLIQVIGDSQGHFLSYNLLCLNLRIYKMI